MCAGRAEEAVVAQAEVCGGCTYATLRGPATTPAFNALYWDFMSRHRQQLSGNRRMGPVLSTLDRFDAASAARSMRA